MKQTKEEVLDKLEVQANNLDERLEEFKCVGYYAHWEILAKDKERIIYDRKENRIVTEYKLKTN